jgi:hypothetical protein
MKTWKTVLASAVLWLTALEASSGDSVAVSEIEADALQDVAGITSLNMAAGDSIIQSNDIALAISEGGIASALVSTSQILEDFDEAEEELPGLAVARIGEGAFAGSKGLISVNQASGRGNVQANSVAIALGIEGEALADSVLSQSLPGATPPNDERHVSTGNREVSVEEGAFGATQGIVQVNQTAGAWNATANALAIRVTVD